MWIHERLEKYKHYENALFLTNLESLQERRNILNLKFAQSGLKYNKLNDLLTENEKKHKMEMRNVEKYEVQFANTELLKK